MNTVRAIDVVTGDEGFDVRLNDGRRLWVPYEWFPRLAAANHRQRENWQLIGNGEGLHWPELDEDLSVEGLLRGMATNGMRRSG
jgi:hypothetical protein